MSPYPAPIPALTSPYKINGAESTPSGVYGRPFELSSMIYFQQTAKADPIKP